MGGAEAIIQTLADGGVRVCFSNPGSSGIHLIAGLDSTPGIRGILCLFEGVATGAADGYGRMAQRPACTLLHMGPGLGNGLANLHNARRARTPVVNLVGDHATRHKPFDPPLESNIDAMAGTVSAWVHRCVRAQEAGVDAAAALAAAGSAPGAVATLILPSDVLWSPQGAAVRVARPRTPEPDAGAVNWAARLLRGDEKCALLLGGDALRRAGLHAAAGIAAATGARVLAEKSPARHERGAGIPHIDRLAYLGERAAAQLAGTRHLILVGARPPVSFYAYPGKPSTPVPEGCAVHELAAPGAASAALAHVVEAVARCAAGPKAAPPPRTTDPPRPELPSGALTAQKVALLVGALLPEGAIVTEEANTADVWLPSATAGSAPHDWLNVTGGAVGMGLPVATGAAAACPDRPVVALEADGSALYTLQALWTQAREGHNVTTVVYNNASYAILGQEFQRVLSPAPDDAATDAEGHPLFALPGLDFLALARGMGVPAVRAHTSEEFAEQFRKALAEPGPHLIDAIVPR